ncbi:MAG: hypothetical protein RL014_2731 [Pseudomonadota bacterium]|jgi:nucleoside-diphosphate-sugar epimerase
MKILLTGADGFTGMHLAQAASACGHHVVPLAAPLQDAQAVQAEVLNIAPDAVVHLAAISYVDHGNTPDFYAVNTVGTTHLLDALLDLPRPPCRVLLASSANVYGNNPNSPIPETAALAPVNHYAASKLAMEALARQYTPHLPITIVRPFNYTGVGQGSHFVIPKLVQHFAQRSRVVKLGNLHVLREYNPVELVVAAYLHLLTHEKTGTWNICSGAAWSLQDVISLLGGMTGHVVDVQVDPALVRRNELHTLYGDPTLLRQSFRDHGTPWPLSDTDPSLDLRAVLGRMLDAVADKRSN